MLREWFAADPMTYIAGNSFLYYERGNPRRHVSPDIFVVRGIPKLPPRRRYLVWEEKKAPDLIIELTSSTTVDEDVEAKFALYRDVLRVREYFLFDPLEECLEPRLQGYRLGKAGYTAIRRVKGRLPSRILGLHLEANDWELRLFDPAARRWLPTPAETRKALDAERQARLAERQARLAAEAAIERLKNELEESRRRSKA
jgi:Uma2 family endonuclease